MGLTLFEAIAFVLPVITSDFQTRCTR